MNSNGTNQMGKHVHLAARYNKVLVKTKTSMSIFLAGMFLQSFTKHFEAIF